MTSHNRFLIFLLLLSSVLSGQSYNTAFGLRFGEDAGFSLSQRVLRRTTIEVAGDPGFFRPVQYGHLVVRKHYPLLTRRFCLFLGAGVAARQDVYPEGTMEPSSFGFGPGLQVGAELTLGRMNVTMDFSPYAIKRDSENNFLWYSGKSVSLRYVLWKRPGRMASLFTRR